MDIFKMSNSIKFENLFLTFFFHFFKGNIFLMYNGNKNKK